MRTTVLQIAALSATLFLVATIPAAMQRRPTDFDLLVQRHVHALRTKSTVAVSRALHFAGGFYAVAAIGLVVALISWKTGERRRSAAILLAILTGGVTLVAFKAAVGRPRPDEAEWLVHETGKGFPSGHTAGATGLGLFAVVEAWRLRKSCRARWGLLIAMAAYAFLMGFARLCVGVHYLTDVIGGWFLGLAVSGVCWVWSVKEVHP